MILLQLFYPIFHLSYGLDIGAREGASHRKIPATFIRDVNPSALDFDLILESVNLQYLALEFSIPFDIALVDSIELSVQGQSQIFQSMVDLGLETGHVVVHSLLLPADLGFEHFYIPLLEFE